MLSWKTNVTRATTTASIMLVECETLVTIVVGGYLRSVSLRSLINRFLRSLMYLHAECKRVKQNFAGEYPQRTSYVLPIVMTKTEIESTTITITITDSFSSSGVRLLSPLSSISLSDNCWAPMVHSQAGYSLSSSSIGSLPSFSILTRIGTPSSTTSSTAASVSSTSTVLFFNFLLLPVANCLVCIKFIVGAAVAAATNLQFCCWTPTNNVIVAVENDLLNAAPPIALWPTWLMLRSPADVVLCWHWRHVGETDVGTARITRSCRSGLCFVSSVRSMATRLPRCDNRAEKKVNKKTTKTTKRK